MALFLTGYLVVGVLWRMAVYGLSNREAPDNRCRVALLVLYVLAILGVLFATGALEAFGWNRLYSTLVALAVLGGIYAADTLGKRARERKGK